MSCTQLAGEVAGYRLRQPLGGQGHMSLMDAEKGEEFRCLQSVTGGSWLLLKLEAPLALDLLVVS